MTSSFANIGDESGDGSSSLCFTRHAIKSSNVAGNSVSESSTSKRFPTSPLLLTLSFRLAVFRDAVARVKLVLRALSALFTLSFLPVEGVDFDAALLAFAGLEGVEALESDPSSFATTFPFALPLPLPVGIGVADTSRSESLPAALTRERFVVDVLPLGVGLGSCCDACRFFAFGVKRWSRSEDIGVGAALALPEGCGVIGVGLAPILAFKLGLGFNLSFGDDDGTARLELAPATLVVSFELSRPWARPDAPFLP